MKLSEILPKVIQLIGEIESLKGVSLITSQQKDHNTQLQHCISNHGLVLVLTITQGRLKKESTSLVHLENTVTISVVENVGHNKRKLSALETVETLLEHLHKVRSDKARSWLQVDKEAYETGPIEGGLNVFFINLTATSING